MTIQEILHRAFEQIRDEHNVALQHVRFDTSHIMAMGGSDKFLCNNVEFEAVAVRTVENNN